VSFEDSPAGQGLPCFRPRLAADDPVAHGGPIRQHVDRCVALTFMPVSELFMPNPTHLTLVVPCFNEQEVLPEFHRRAGIVADQLRVAGVETDFIFVDDNSRDKTWAVLDEMAMRDRRVRAIRFARNRGHQIAVTAGLDFAEGDVIVIMDADLQDPPEAIPAMLGLVREGFDIVHAQRRQRQGETLFKLASARLFYWLLHRFSNVEIVQNAGDFRAITRPVVLAAREFREPHRFLRGMFSAMGFRQTIFQYDRDARYAGETKYPLRKMVKLAGDALFSFSSTPIRAIVWSSFVLWGLSLIYLAVSLYAHFFGKSTITGWTSVVFLMTFFTGVILMSIAVVGSYVGRIFEQGQHRPLYWLERAANIRIKSESMVGAPREMRVSRAILASRQSALASSELIESKPETRESAVERVSGMETLP
jgi:dolichol-phosphate mannosyltransferase